MYFLRAGIEGADVVQLNREISHENVVALKEVILEDKSIYMVFEYAEHDFLVCPITTAIKVCR